MKGLSITGLIISILIFLLAMYLQFAVVPAVSSLESMIDYNDESGLSSMMWAQAHSMKVNLGMVTLFGGILPLILCIIPALKTKSKLAWTGVVLSFIAIVIGILSGTHMFS